MATDSRATQPDPVRVEIPAEDGRTVVHYYFPVEIEVRAAPTAPLDPVASLDDALLGVARELRRG